MSGQKENREHGNVTEEELAQFNYSLEVYWRESLFLQTLGDSHTGNPDPEVCIKCRRGWYSVGECHLFQW